VYGLSVGSIRANIVLNTRSWDAPANKVLSDVKALSRNVSTLGRTLLGVGLGLTGIGKIAVQEFGKFDKAMHDATAVSEVTEEQFAQMAESAERAGIKWNIAAQDTAKAFLYLGRAGLTATEQMDAFNPIVTGSKAMMEDLEKTTVGVVNVIRSFEMEFGETERVVNVLTKAVNESTQDLGEMLAAMSYAGTPAHAMNNSLEDLAAILQVMADRGIRGSKAGTALRFSLMHLARPTAEMRRLMLNLGLQVHDSEGKLKPFIDIIGDLQEKLDGMSQKARDYTIGTLFGTRAATGMIALYETGRNKIREVSDELHKLGDDAEKVAGKQMKSLPERFGQIRQQAAALARDIGGSLEPAFMSWFDKLEVRFERIRAWIGDHREETAQIVKNLAKIALVSVAVGALMVFVPYLIGAFNSLTAIASRPFVVLLAGLYVFRAAWKKDLWDMRSDFNEWKEKLFEGSWGDKLKLSLFPAIGLISGGLLLKMLLAGAGAAGVTVSAPIAALLGVLMLGGGFLGGTKLSKHIPLGGTDESPDDTKEKVKEKKPKIGVAPKDIPMPEIYDLTGMSDEDVRKLGESHGVKITPNKETGWYDIAPMVPKVKPDTIKTPGVRPDSIGVSRSFEIDKDAEDKQKKEDKKDTLGGYLKEMGKEFKAAIESAAKDIGSAVVGQAGEDFQWSLDKGADVVEKFFPGAGRALNEMLGVARDFIDSLDEPVKPKLPPQFPFGDMDEHVKAKRLYDDYLAEIERRKLKPTGGYYYKTYFNQWRDVTAEIIENLNTMTDAFTTAQQDIIGGWTNAFDKLMQKGSSVKGFFRDLFDSIIASMRRMVAEALAQDLFKLLLGFGMKREMPGQELSMLGFVGDLFKDWKFFQGGGNVPDLGPVPEHALPYHAPKLAPASTPEPANVTINLSNESGQPVRAKQVGGAQFNGRDWIVNMVLEAMEDDHEFRAAIRYA